MIGQVFFARRVKLREMEAENRAAPEAAVALKRVPSASAEAPLAAKSEADWKEF